MSKYLIVAKRSANEPPEWREQLENIPGLTVENPGARRLRVEATPDAIQEARRSLAEYCHIEPIIVHNMN